MINYADDKMLYKTEDMIANAQCNTYTEIVLDCVITSKRLRNYLIALGICQTAAAIPV